MNSKYTQLFYANTIFIKLYKTNKRENEYPVKAMY